MPLTEHTGAPKRPKHTSHRSSQAGVVHRVTVGKTAHMDNVDDAAEPGSDPAVSASSIVGWDMVPGQQEAVARLRAAVENPVHAYLFVGPEGSGKRAALRAFAGELFAASFDGDVTGADRQRRLAADEHHPDLVIVEPEGAVFRGGSAGSDGETEASIVIREAHRSPVEGARKIVAADAFHTANDSAVGALLKTIEEPPARTTIVLLADAVPTGQAAIASRCVRIDFHALDVGTLRDQLVHEGVDPDRADLAVAAAGGNLDRARVLATDERLALRVDAWRDVPMRLDGSGAEATAAVAELRAMLDDALAPVTTRHEAELTRFDEEVEQYGLGSTVGRRNALKARQRRIERQSRTSELRLGLTTMATVYRDEAIVAAHPGPLLDAIDELGATTRALSLNPNEELALTALFWRLPALRS
jgi:DNA polymerase-3 subunit delta'